MRGEAGEGAIIKINGQQGSIASPIVRGDEVIITPSTKGAPAQVSVESLAEGARSICFNVNGHKVAAPRLLLVNGKEAEPDMFVQNGDSIEEADYYTAGRLLEYMDVEAIGTISINNVPALKEDKVYENFSIDFELAGEDSSLDNHDEMLQDISGVEEPKASDKPSETEKTQVLPDKSEASDKAGSKDDGKTSGAGPAPKKQESAGGESIVVTVNGTPVALKGKDLYRLVDVLDVYPSFDTKNPQGDRAVIRINGEDTDFIHEIYRGDQIELRWE